MARRKNFNLAEYLNPIQSEILFKIKLGVPISRICKEYGISRPSLYNYFKSIGINNLKKEFING